MRNRKRNLLIFSFVVLFLIISSINSYIVYKSIDITGKAVGVIGLQIFTPCTINLGQGWNYISLCAEPANKSITSVLSNVNYRYVMVWNEATQEYDIYSPRAANPPFNEFDTNKSYFIYYLDSAGELEVYGNEFDDVNISMLWGWNPPAWPYLFTGNISKYLESIANQYRYVMKWNYTPQAFIIYSPRAAEPAFTTISKGEGQFIYVTNASGAVLRYNKTYLESNP